MTVKNQQRFFLSSVLTIALLTGTTSVQALAQLTSTTASIQSLVLLAGITAAQTIDENEDIDIESLGLSLAELFDLEVTIATGAKQTVAKAPAVTTVITAQDIEAMGATDLDEVLETVPGLHVARNSNDYNPIYSIRGTHSDYNPEVLMLINGISIKQYFFGNRSLIWGGMPVEAISRIEVIRGPGSAVYGADAFVGVINIITKTKKDIDGTEVGARVGSFNTQDIWVLHGNKWGEFDVALMLEYHKTNGHGGIVDADLQTAHDKLFDTDVSNAPGPLNLQRDNFDARLDISKGYWQLRAGYQGRLHWGTGPGAASALDPVGSFKEQRINADFTYHNPEVTHDWDVTAQISIFELLTNFKDKQYLLPIGNAIFPKGLSMSADWYERNTRATFSAFYSGFNKHLIRVGTGYHYVDVYKTTLYSNMNSPSGEIINLTDTDQVVFPEGNRNDWYVFMQDAWAFQPNWELTAGVRYDEYSDFGKTINPRLAMVWQMLPDLTTKLLYGRAFRAPSHSELRVTNSVVAHGNPDLKPEIMETWELAFDHRATDNLHFALNLFFYEITDKVLFVLTSPDSEVLSAVNIGAQKGHGLEFEARWKMSNRTNLLFNYAYQNSTDKTNNHEVANTPQHQVYLRSDWLLFPNWFLNTQANWVGKRARVLDDPRMDVDDYTTVDLTLRRKNLKEHWDITMSVRNLFDEDGREPTLGPDSSGIIAMPNDMPMAERNYWLEIGYHF